MHNYRYNSNNKWRKPLHMMCLLLGIVLLLSACGQAQKPSSATDSNTGSNAGSNSGQSSSSPEQNIAPPQEEVPEEPQEEVDPVQEQLSSLTLEEKIGQMILAGVQGTTLDDQAKQMITDQKVGGIIFYANNVSTLEGTAKFVKSIKEANQSNPVPIFMSVDQEGGKVSRMPETVESIPSSRKVGETKDSALAETMGELLARQVQLAGFNVDFAPVLDVNSNPKNPVIGDRSFGRLGRTGVTYGDCRDEGIT